MLQVARLVSDHSAASCVQVNQCLVELPPKPVDGEASTAAAVLQFDLPTAQQKEDQEDPCNAEGAVFPEKVTYHVTKELLETKLKETDWDVKNTLTIIRRMPEKTPAEDDTLASILFDVMDQMG